MAGRHAQLSAYLMGLWGMSEPVIEAIAFHHCPRWSTGEHFSALTSLHAAEALDSMLQPAGQIGKPMTFDDEYLEACGLAERVGAWEDKAREGFGVMNDE